MRENRRHERHPRADARRQRRRPLLRGAVLGLRAAGHLRGSRISRRRGERVAVQGLVRSPEKPRINSAARCSIRNGRGIRWVTSKIIFIEPSATGIVFHNNVMGDALNIDVRIFVEELVLAVEKWLTTVETTLEYQKNIASGVKRYPNGLPPYIVGLPVIA